MSRYLMVISYEKWGSFLFRQNIYLVLNYSQNTAFTNNYTVNNIELH